MMTIELVGGTHDGRTFEREIVARYFETPTFDERGFVAVKYEAFERGVDRVRYRWVEDWWLVDDPTAEDGVRIERFTSE